MRTGSRVGGDHVWPCGAGASSLGRSRLLPRLLKICPFPPVGRLLDIRSRPMPNATCSIARRPAGREPFCLGWLVLRPATKASPRAMLKAAGAAVLQAAHRPDPAAELPGAHYLAGPLTRLAAFAVRVSSALRLAGDPRR